MNEQKKPTRDDLIKQLPSTGWEAHGLKNRTLEELVRTAHARHKKGEELDVIKGTEAEFEVDLVQLQELWAHLGLPM